MYLHAKKSVNNINTTVCVCVCHEYERDTYLNVVYFHFLLSYILQFYCNDKNTIPLFYLSSHEYIFCCYVDNFIVILYSTRFHVNINMAIVTDIHTHTHKDTKSPELSSDFMFVYKVDAYCFFEF